MKLKYSRHAATLYVFAAAAALIAIPALAEDTVGGHAANLCKPTEEIYFSCSAGKKILSLCTSPGISAISGTMQYRFGTKKNVELTYPDSPQRPQTAFRFYHESSAHAGTQALGFKIGDFTYSLFDTKSTYGYSGAGVIVGRSDRRVTLIVCDEKTTVDQRFQDTWSLDIPETVLDVMGAETPIK